MKKLIAFCYFIFGLSVLTQAQVEVYFDFNSHIIKPDAIQKLQVLVESTKQTGGIYYLIGHADSVGNQAYNLQLSKQRVEAIEHFLIEQGVDEQNITTAYKGEVEASNINPAYNRKVAVEIRQSVGATEVLDALLSELKPETQHFTFNPDTGIVITGKDGTVIRMGRNLLSLPNGELPTEQVEVELVEYYDMASFFGEKLYTSSNGKVIESGGMISLNVYANGEPLSVQEGKTYDIAFPKANDSIEGFQTFYGERLPNGNMNWVTEAATPEKSFSEGLKLFVSEDEAITLKDGKCSHKELKMRFVPSLGKYVNMQDAENEIYKEEAEEYEEEEKRLATKYEEDSKATYELQNNSSNILQSSQLGFINCDRFLNDRQARKVDIIAKIDNPDIAPISASIILTGYNSILPISFYQKNTAYRLQTRLPIDKPIKLLVLGYNRVTKETVMYTEEIELKPRIFREISPEPTTLADIKAELAKK